ncbi:MAG: histidine kinase [Bacteroidota bacterium]
MWQRPVRIFSFYLLLFCCLAKNKVSGQSFNESEFRLHTSKEGLSHNRVTSIEQDEQGYMWVGTDAGLNRYDGHTFNNYTANTEPFSLASGFIRQLKHFGKDELGVITRQGFQLINTRNFSVKNYFIPDSTAFKSLRNAAWDALPLADQSVALTTATGFYIFGKDKQLLFRHDAYELGDVGKKRIFYGRFLLPFSSKDLLVFVEEDRLAHYDISSRNFHELKEQENSAFNFHPVATHINRGLIHHYQLSKNEFLFFHFAQNSIVYYNTISKKQVTTNLPVSKIKFSWESKIFRLSDSTFAVNGATVGFYIFYLNRQTSQITMNPNLFLDGYKVLCMKNDKNGKLWVGTSKGLLQQRESNRLLNTIEIGVAKKENVTGGLSCAYRYKNNLYLGRDSYSNGMTIVDPVSKNIKKQITFFKENSGWNEIFSIQMYHPDTLFIGTSEGIIWLDTKTNHYDKVKVPAAVNKKLNVLAPLRTDGYAWMLSHLNGVVARYHIPTRTYTIFNSNSDPVLPFTKIKHITYDAYGDVWIGGHSLARWNNRINAFDTIITVYSGTNKYNENILMLNADSHGSLWIHNTENGLLEYRIKEKSWKIFGIKDGLPSDVFESFSTIIHDTLWLGSANNLSCFNILNKQAVVFDYSDGYTEETPKGNKIIYDGTSNQLYLFTNQLLTTFSAPPKSVVSIRSDIIIQELRVNNKRSIYHPLNNVELQHGEQNLSLSFSIVDFENSNYRFFYKMDDKADWIPLKEVRNINLSWLNPGNYSIYLKAIGKSGSQHNQLFSFVILKPWWQSTLYKIIVTLITALVIFAVYRFRIKQVQLKAEIDKQLAQAEMKALHAQMNPHFISNSLNSIREMILNDNNRDASRYLTKFAHLIRITLEHSLVHFVSLNSTIDYLNRYAEMEKIRSSKFTFNQQVAKGLQADEVLLPPMLIQPFIENAIWHGANLKGINITVGFSQENDQLICVIEDDGVGIRQTLEQKKLSPELRKSIGIENIRNRIELLNEKYDMKSSITIRDKAEGNSKDMTGTIVTLKLKLQTRDI